MERLVLSIISIALSSFSLGIALCNLLHLLFGSVGKSDWRSQKKGESKCQR